ncbi:hypothetical protein [Alkalinema sp. FACHB-956]|uniref:hypothetical protein n=1 Tax=Alkalinema sp. FACHB-956 TaxID=2692768 RepID=UPI00168437EA|nr:hypothetical protein [Alkalinema sp. FACHB-956]MBD2325456.1 hypothetical protein [Alkalinema sp. FACHB-956]
MSQANMQVCSICGVKIQKLIGQDMVFFSTGAKSTREVLYQRVCQHVKDRPGCINKEGRAS